MCVEGNSLFIERKHENLFRLLDYLDEAHTLMDGWNGTGRSGAPELEAKNITHAFVLNKR